MASALDYSCSNYFLGFLKVLELELDVFLSLSLSSDSEDSCLSLPRRLALCRSWRVYCSSLSVLDLREFKRFSLKIAALVCGLTRVVWRGFVSLGSVLSLSNTGCLFPILALAGFVLWSSAIFSLLVFSSSPAFWPP